MNADNRTGLHGFEASLEKQFLEKGVANLHVGPLGFRSLAEFFARHGRAVNSIAPGFGADVNHWIAFAGSSRVENLVLAHQAESERIYQRIAGIARLELCLAT